MAERYCSAVSALMESVRRESVISLDLQHIIHCHFDACNLVRQVTNNIYRHLCYSVPCMHNC